MPIDRHRLKTRAGFFAAALLIAAAGQVLAAKTYNASHSNTAARSAPPATCPHGVAATRSGAAAHRMAVKGSGVPEHGPRAAPAGARCGKTAAPRDEVHGAYSGKRQH
jgi:hypothetical protein